jgi:hypothetical protein
MEKNGQGKLIDLDELNNEANDDTIKNNLFLKRFKRICNRNQLLECAVLAGCDYLPSVKNMGLKTAAKYYDELANTQLILNKIKSNKSHNMPHNYPLAFYKAVLTFRHQYIYNTLSKEFSHLTPLPKDLEEKFHSIQSHGRNYEINDLTDDHEGHYKNEENTLYNINNTTLQRHHSELDNLDFLGKSLECEVEPFITGKINPKNLQFYSNNNSNYDNDNDRQESVASRGEVESNNVQVSFPPLSIASRIIPVAKLTPNQTNLLLLRSLDIIQPASASPAGQCNNIKIGCSPLKKNQFAISAATAASPVGLISSILSSATTAASTRPASASSSALNKRRLAAVYDVKSTGGGIMNHFKKLSNS